MSTSANTPTGDYDLRSLQHERRMLAVYRRQAAHDAAALQPLANACWRAASFEWALYRDADTVRRLWGEAAEALARGFARRQPGFDPSPDQLILALHFAIAARSRDAFTTIALSAPNLRDGVLRGARAFRSSRAHFHLAEVTRSRRARSLRRSRTLRARPSPRWRPRAPRWTAAGGSGSSPTRSTRRGA